MEKVIPSINDNIADTLFITVYMRALDDRYSRVKNASKAIFYELDIPECIQLRKQLIPTHPNQFLISGSAFEPGWLEKLREKHPDGNFIFIAEGVFMYFSEKEISRLLCSIADNFPNARIIFDGLSETLSRHSDKHDTLRNAKAVFAWGFDDNHIFEKWHPGLKLDKVFYIMHGMRKYSFPVRLISYIPMFGKGSKIILLSVRNFRIAG